MEQTHKGKNIENSQLPDRLKLGCKHKEGKQPAKYNISELVIDEERKEIHKHIETTTTSCIPKSKRLIRANNHILSNQRQYVQQVQETNSTHSNDKWQRLSSIQFNVVEVKKIA